MLGPDNPTPRNMPLNAQFKEIIERYGLLEVYAFGSQAKAVARRLQGKRADIHFESDVDIGVQVNPGRMMSPLHRVELSIALEDLLEASRVDLVVISEADAFLAAEIIRGELLYAEDMDRQARYELFVLRRAGDLLPLKRDRIRMIMEEGAR
jgi:predicted nucleotidyltransferase